jgi:hypothetical protein
MGGPRNLAGRAEVSRFPSAGIGSAQALETDGGIRMSTLLLVLLVLLVVFAIGGGLVVSKLLWLLLVVALAGLLTGRTA